MASRKIRGRAPTKKLSKEQDDDKKDGSSEHGRDAVEIVNMEKGSQQTKDRGKNRVTDEAASEDVMKKGTRTKVNLKKSMGKTDQEQNKTVGEGRDREGKERTKKKVLNRDSAKVKNMENRDRVKDEKSKSKKDVPEKKGISTKASIKITGKKAKRENDQEGKIKEIVEKDDKQRNEVKRKKREQKTETDNRRDTEKQTKIEAKKVAKIERAADKTKRKTGGSKKGDKRDVGGIIIRNETRGRKKKAEETSDIVNEEKELTTEESTTSGKDELANDKVKKTRNADEKSKKNKDEDVETKVKNGKKRAGKKVKPVKEKVLESKQKKRNTKEADDRETQHPSISLSKRVRRGFESKDATRGTDEGLSEKKKEQEQTGKKRKEKKVAGLLEKVEDQKMVVKKKEDRHYKPEELVDQKTATKKKDGKKVAGLLEKVEDQKMVVKKKEDRHYKPEELVDQKTATKKKDGKKVVGLLEKSKDQKMIISSTETKKSSSIDNTVRKNDQTTNVSDGSRQKRSPHSVKAKKIPAKNSEDAVKAIDKNEEEAIDVSVAPENNIFKGIEPKKEDDKSDLLITKALEKICQHKDIEVKNVVFNVYAKMYPFNGETYTDPLEGTLLVSQEPLRLIFVRKGIKQVMFDSVINYDTKAILKDSRVTFGVIYEDKEKKLDLYAAKFFKGEDATRFYELIAKIG
ncbi:hypothetical protein VCUG_00122 [Vavraia culicis subsp. floridensis]|uniref:RanBD1 domain-containing protein n=1 Tax=Vavraia culicis (isolate floridensis) TaxID=948595 RepID=L2GX75_VAVCU|nr:uncharacterized protein VCUG_00122 [Vavraia culicis subsp. floridensis]ELA48286.1 hypothetical protein VCUG_00122 [Vavraia culicis subsp. floridensis]